jgi:predicted ester cyclase
VLTVMTDGPRHGRAAVQEYLVELFRGMPGRAASVVSVAAAGADVVAEVELCVRWAGDSLDAAAAGGRARARLYVRATVADGRIREEWVCSRPPVSAAAKGALLASARP